jgi:hypothetical protein
MNVAKLVELAARTRYTSRTKELSVRISEATLKALEEVRSALDCTTSTLVEAILKDGISVATDQLRGVTPNVWILTVRSDSETDILAAFLEMPTTAALDRYLPVERDDTMSSFLVRYQDVTRSGATFALSRLGISQ